MAYVVLQKDINDLIKNQIGRTQLGRLAGLVGVGWLAGLDEKTKKHTHTHTRNYAEIEST